MADKQIGNKLGVTAKDPTTTFAGAADATNEVEANFDSIAAMKARLLDADNGYTQSQVDSMTYNDLVYALRVEEYSSTI